MKKLTILSILFAGLGVSACDSGAAAPPEGTDAGVDAGGGDVDAGGVEIDAGSGLSCSYPTGPYQTTVGRQFQPFTLPQCDGTPYDFVNEEFCAARFTVISIAAGWCVPCRYESEHLTKQITDMYSDRGVRVIQVLVQDDEYRAADAAFCEGWVDTYGLTNIELVDATGVTQRYFPGGSLPSTVIVDSNGIIVSRENGVNMWLSTLRAKLDMLLAGP